MDRSSILNRPFAGVDLGVFKKNRGLPFHRWYPFVEGYSAELVEIALGSARPEGLIFDPFGGSGTTALTASMTGHSSFFTEVNPYMAWVADVKVNQARMATMEGGARERLLTIADRLSVVGANSEASNPSHPLTVADAKRSYFPPGVAAHALSLLDVIEDSAEGPVREIARLAVATSLVPASQMVRRTDLRKRTAGDPSPVPLKETVVLRLQDFASDLETHGHHLTGTATMLESDVRRAWTAPSEIGLIITSPPYLNGTNYCRNTKLELLTMGFISGEKQLSELRASSITAGINNVSRALAPAGTHALVEPLAEKLEAVAYDVRIPKMVRSYFADMEVMLRRVRNSSRVGALFYLDIGDSKYSGVHIPTHTILGAIAETTGWRLIDEHVIRQRRSHDGSVLTQVLLCMEATQ